MNSTEADIMTFTSINTTTTNSQDGSHSNRAVVPLTPPSSSDQTSPSKTSPKGCLKIRTQEESLLSCQHISRKKLLRNAITKTLSLTRRATQCRIDGLLQGYKSSFDQMKGSFCRQNKSDELFLPKRNETFELKRNESFKLPKPTDQLRTLYQKEKVVRHRRNICPSVPTQNNVKFHQIEIREYEKTLGIDPGNRNSGPVLCLGWDYTTLKDIEIDDYEKSRKNRLQTVMVSMKNQI